LADLLNSEYPNWGLAGNQAVIPFGVGLGASTVVRYIADPQGPPNLAGQILPAQIIGSSLMFLNLRDMRRKNLTLPSWADWNDYATLLSVEVIKAGLGVFVCPQLALWHDCSHKGDTSKQEQPSTETLAYLRRILKNSMITTPTGAINLGSEFSGSDQRLDLEMASLRAAAIGRPRKTVAVVVRTRFTRPKSYLNRTISTAKALAAAAGDSTNFEIYIVTDKKSSPLAEYDGLLADIKIIEFEVPEVDDSRYHLVKHAATGIKADYFWFIDDDDWVFPNEAERLALAINAVPDESLIFLDCRHFYETPGPCGNEAAGKIKAGKTFFAKTFIMSLSGKNETPFCGVIYPHSLFLSIPEQCYKTVVYYEDFMSTMYALLMGRYLPVAVDKLFAGISIRPSGNTVTETNRRNWMYANSVVTSHLVNMPGGSQMMSLPLSALLNSLPSTSLSLRFRTMTLPLRRLAIKMGIPHYALLRIYSKTKNVFIRIASALSNRKNT